MIVTSSKFDFHFIVNCSEQYVDEFDEWIDEILLEPSDQSINIDGSNPTQVAYFPIFDMVRTLNEFIKRRHLYF